jgi:hypothetical protein
MPNKLRLAKIISGGQTGVDEGALSAAAKLDLATGGWMPRGFRTEEGVNPALARRYGLREHESSEWLPRTEKNVELADATLILGKLDSPGCRATLRYCREYRRPVYTIYWTPELDHCRLFAAPPFVLWLRLAGIRTLNVAGNRESSQPGIKNVSERFLYLALKDHV